MSYRNNSNSRRPGGDFSGYRVYVGDIGQRISRSDLEREFGQYGPVTDVWMGNKREPSAPDYAFVVFRYPEDADEAVRDRNGRKICGRQVRVEHARPMNNRRGRGGGGWGGGGNRDYGSQRGNPAPSRRRSYSRERGSNRRSRSQSPVQGGRVQQSYPAARQRTDSYNKKVSRRSPSDSPDEKSMKYKKSTRRQSSPSQSPPPLPRSNQKVQDSDSANSSPSPPPKKKQRARSDSESPRAEDEYDARQYQRSQEQGNSRQGKPTQPKGNYADDDSDSSN